MNLAELLQGNWALPIVAGAALIPVTLGFYRKFWAIGVGYGLSVATASGVVLAAAAATSAPGSSTLVAIHGLGVVAHGVRLATFLLRREKEILQLPQAGAEWKKKMDTLEGQQPSFKDRVRRTPFILSVAFLYTCMAAPVLFHFQNPLRSPQLTLLGLSLQWFGWAYNSIADYQKSAYKRQWGDSAVWCSTGLYTYSRHPNYFGEQVFWLGNFLAGVPSYSSAAQWAMCLLGLVGIQGILGGATKRLDQKQREKYTSSKYKEYLASTNCSIPKLF